MLRSLIYTTSIACLLLASSHAAAQRTSDARLVLRLPIDDRARSAAVTAVAVSPQGDLIAAGGDGHAVRLFDGQTGELVATIPAHRDWVRATSFSPDGQKLATVGADHTLRVWSTSGASAPLTVHKCAGPLQAVAFHPTKNQAATVGFGDHLRMFDLGANEEVGLRGCACDDTRAVAISPEGRWAAAAGRNGVIRVWDLDASGGSFDLPTDGRRVRSLAFSPDSGVLASAGDGPAVRLWRAEDWQVGASPTPQELLIRPGKAHAVAFVADNLLAVGGTPNRITVWDTDAASPLAQLAGHTGTVASLAVSADGRTLVSGSFDTTVRVWDTRRIGERTNVAGGPRLVR
ncbi:MAG: WD40 repeat domain-containing protein [Planctomycetota bacterium]